MAADNEADEADLARFAKRSHAEAMRQNAPLATHSLKYTRRAAQTCGLATW